MASKREKKVKKKARNCLLQARCNHDEQREIHTKAVMYAKGEMSEFVRMACLNYRPLRRVAK
jgi:hypothetical protein